MTLKRCSMVQSPTTGAVPISGVGAAGQTFEPLELADDPSSSPMSLNTLEVAEAEQRLFSNAKRTWSTPAAANGRQKSRQKGTTRKK